METAPRLSLFDAITAAATRPGGREDAQATLDELRRMRENVAPKKKKKRRTKKIKKKKKKHKTRNHYKKTDKKKKSKNNTKIGGSKNKNKNRNRKKKQFFEMSIAELQQHVKQLSNK